MIMAGFETAGNGGVSHRWYWLVFSPALIRHSLATNMLRQGATLDEIGDVLRHRTRMTTTIYAKLDIDALRSIARPWPVQGGAR